VNPTLVKLLKPLASLRLTVVLLSLAMVLVFAGTWAQIDQDVWSVQKRYFHSFFTWIDLQLFLPRPVPPARPIPGGFPMPGGYTIIALLLVNLISAHALRFKFHKLDLLIPLELGLILALAWPTYALGFYVMFAVIFAASIPLVAHAILLHEKRGGVVLIHLGLVLLICGEVVTSLAQRERRMVIDEGQTVSWVEEIRNPELVVIDPTPPDHDNVVSIPASRVKPGSTIDDARLPFAVRVNEYFQNSSRTGSGEFTARPRESGMSTRINAPTVFVSLLARDGRELHTCALSYLRDEPQTIDLDGKSYRLDLRPRRLYRPYRFTLIDFAFDRYTGTNVPVNYSSLVRLVDPERNEDRQVKIWMNHPLRYRGEAFFQQSFDETTERTTVLQVVENPGWLVPYASCAIVTIGMTIHFGAHLLTFLRRRPAASLAPSQSQDRPTRYTLNPRPGILLPFIAVGACALFVLYQGRPPKLETSFDLNALARIPISDGGRVMPLDSLARNSLRVISGRSELRDEQTGKKLPAIRWLIDTLSNRDASVQYKAFRITHPDLLHLLSLDSRRKLFSIDELRPKFEAFGDQFQRAARVEKNDRNPFQRAVIELGEHIKLFNRMQAGSTLYVAPPVAGAADWTTLDESGKAAQANPGSPPNPGFAAYWTLLTAYAADESDAFNEAADRYLAYVWRNLPSFYRKTNAEVIFNYFAPFYSAMVLYVAVFLLVCASWLILPARATLQRAAFWALGFTVLFHAAGLAARVYISGRPPVTNLYSSAIFIGFGAALLCLGIEWVHRNGVGSLAAAVVAFPSLIVAHFLAGTTGDTMQMLQAVLDTNFWLATHVVVITLGYAATFLAGMLAVVYVLRAAFFRFDETGRRTAARMVYGIVCFAMLFSFVGTVLGGIWADQSWGRFWGWDPKENGAVLIVLWNAAILHARWGGLIRERGLMNMAIFGNVVTSWSWFGTNMLGIGFHSYGFMQSGPFWLGAFMALQLVLMGIGTLRHNRVRS
jgi:ABC-type transport system involved in cytochrome c biogenesis permease subunit